jgi:hypothetical protein
MTPVSWYGWEIASGEHQIDEGNSSVLVAWNVGGVVIEFSVAFTLVIGRDVFDAKGRAATRQWPFGRRPPPTNPAVFPYIQQSEYVPK